MPVFLLNTVDCVALFVKKLLTDNAKVIGALWVTKSVEYLNDLFLTNLDETSPQYFLNHLTCDLNFKDSRYESDLVKVA